LESGHLGGAQEWEREESRSLHDLNYVIFEELFENAGLIEDVTEIAENASSWGNGGIHSSLDEGMLVRYTGLIQILDPQFVRARIDQLARLMQGIAGAQVGAVPAATAIPPSRKGGSTKPGARAATGDDARERLKAETLSTLLSGSALGQFKDIADAVTAFTNDQISVRVLSCGRDYPDYHFAGTLLSRSEYIQEEREALFGRYGVYLNDWTAVMQIARIPSAMPPSPPDFNRQFVNDDGRIDRTTFEQLAIDLIGSWEQMGLSEGSRYPAISTTILAIYRQFA
jgi:hypothetical protein